MNKYEVIETIGEGAYGVVLKCRNKETGELVAIKRFKESEDDELVRKTTLREVKVLRMLKQETYVVNLVEAFRRKGKLYLVFEYVGCNLLDVLDSHPQGVELDDVRRMVFTLLLGVRACHANGVIHRDIKPENLLCHADQTLRLCDFGFARPYTLGMDDLTDYVATRWYRSPELLLGTSDYGLPSDMWAVGCIMAELLDGQALFPGESELDQLFLIQKLLGNFTPQQVEVFKGNKTFAGYALRDVPRTEMTIERKFGRKASKKSVSLLKSLLVIDPAKRLTVDEALQHSFFEGLLEVYAPQLKLAVPPVTIARPSTADRQARNPPLPSAAQAPPFAATPQLPPAQVFAQHQQPPQAQPQHHGVHVPPIVPGLFANLQPSHLELPMPQPHHLPPQTTVQYGPLQPPLQQHPQGYPQMYNSSNTNGATPIVVPQLQQQSYQQQQGPPAPYPASYLPQPQAFGVSYGTPQQQAAPSSYASAPQVTAQPQPQGPTPFGVLKQGTSSFLPPRVGSGHRRPASQQWHPGMGGQPDGAPSPPSEVGSGAPTTANYGAQVQSNALPRTQSRGDSRGGNLPKLPAAQHGGVPRGTLGGNGGMQGLYPTRLSSNASEASSGQSGNPYKPHQMPPGRSSNRMFYN